MSASSLNNSETDRKLKPILRELNSVSEHIEASAIMSRDGLSVASVLGAGVDPDRLGAMCAALLGLADTTARELNRGTLRQVLIDGTLGYMLITHVGDKAVLAVATKPGTNLGMVFIETKKTADKIAAILGE
ncbi:MAG: roadblock/LC7 domain-containing protein [Gammaproteobacteria bacterium]|nr:roadblock/LC7 domain-containing protein [Gammaproteobacteria bacterium]